MKKKYRFFVLAILVASVMWNVYWNSRIVVHTYTHVNESVPEAFDHLRIVQLTDLHSVRTDKQGQLVYDTICSQNPDVICMTGDLVDSRYYEKNGAEGEKRTLELMEKLVKIAPVYMVYGNHEMVLLDDPQNNALKKSLEEIGVLLINNELVRYEKETGGEALLIGGIQDPSTLYKDYRYAFLESNGERMEAMLDAVSVDVRNEDFFLLLSHRPEYLEMYDQYPVDLVLAGHAHGGQMRFFGRGIISPGQGFLPEYTSGIHQGPYGSMIISRGLSNPYRLIPRLGNPCEVVYVQFAADGDCR